MKRHIDLFSGVGGFALAIDRVWNDVEHVFCDNDLFAQAVLSKHWSNSKIYGDIRTLTANTEIKRKLELAMERKQNKKTTLIGTDNQRIDIITGGFPCQPFSQAGKRRGTEDDRYLWEEMLRVISEFHPRWVVGENVGGLVTWNGGVVLEQIHTDLESQGYEIQTFIIPAVAVNAPHRRDRVWIVGHSISQHAQRMRKESNRKKQNRLCHRENKEWRKNWAEVASRLCRVDDGIPKRLDRTGRLKALGNAIVPQVAEEIFKIIRKIDGK